MVELFAGETKAGGAVWREACHEFSLPAPVLHFGMGAGVRVDGVAQLGGEAEQGRVLLVLEGAVVGKLAFRLEEVEALRSLALDRGGQVALRRRWRLLTS